MGRHLARCSDALGTAATAGGATVMWQNPKLRVTSKLQPLTIHVQEPDRAHHHV
jgi:hypothetical protein